MYQVGIIGLGYRGMYLHTLLLKMSEYIEVVAIADPTPEPSLYDGSWCVYDQGLEDYKRMIDGHKLDLVFIASPWASQLEQALYAVRSGCHIAIEIKAGLRLGEYDELINELDYRGLKAYPLENALFKREVLSLWNICNAGLLGRIVYMRGGYRHDLRSILLDAHGDVATSGEGKWRMPYYLEGQADLYPTHGFAPLALIAGLGRTDSIKSLHSSSSAAWGLRERASTKAKMLLDSANVVGDVVCTQIETEQGILISLTHDTTLPRPRSLDWEIQGTKGIWNGDHRKIYIEECSPKECWEDDSIYVDTYEHDYWKAWGATAIEYDKHHSGMDYIMLRAIIDDLQGYSTYLASIRDLALWCSITPLSRTGY